MKKLWLLCVIPVLFACTREEITVQIVRNPLIKFTTDAYSWEASSYDFREPFQVVQYPSNPSLPARLYTRYVLQASGRADNGQNLQLNLFFDTHEKNQLIGLYRPTYTDERGLANVQLYNLENNNLAAYSLCPHDTASTRLHIQRQNDKEQLIAGTFQVTVCNERDTTQKVVIRNGVLTDIHY